MTNNNEATPNRPRYGIARCEIEPKWKHIPQGTICEFTHADGDTYVGYRFGGSFSSAKNGRMGVHPDNVRSARPLGVADIASKS